MFPDLLCLVYWVSLLFVFKEFLAFWSVFPFPRISRRLPKTSIPIAWYKARIPGFPWKSIREGTSSLFGRRPEGPQNVSCSTATQTCTGAALGLPQSKSHFGIFWPSPEKTTCSFPREFQEFGPCTRQSGSQTKNKQKTVLFGALASRKRSGLFSAIRLQIEPELSIISGCR